MPQGGNPKQRCPALMCLDQTKMLPQQGSPAQRVRASILCQHRLQWVEILRRWAPGCNDHRTVVFQPSFGFQSFVRNIILRGNVNITAARLLLGEKECGSGDVHPPGREWTLCSADARWDLPEPLRPWWVYRLDVSINKAAYESLIKANIKGEVG